MTVRASVAGPLTEATRTLQRLLTTRYAANTSAAGLPAPLVVPLGGADSNRAQHDPAAAQRRTANVHLSADAVLIGPFSQGFAGSDGQACGHCLALRWQSLRLRSERDALETGTATTGIAEWPMLPEYVADGVWALFQAATFSRFASDLPMVWRLDLMSLQSHAFPMFPDPLCPTCRPPAAGPCPAPLTLGSTPKPAPSRYRLQVPASYQLPAAALVNPVCGVLGASTWLNITSPTTAPVAGSFANRGDSGLNDVMWSGQASSYRNSRDVGLLEGLERYAGTRRRSAGEPVVASLDELGDDALDPRDCGVYAPKTYLDEPAVIPFSPGLRIPWVWGHSLREERPVLVPSRLCHYGSSAGTDSFVFETSNGCAIGSCLEEAILFGLLELIERDAFLLGWYGGARLTEIELESCNSSAILAMVDRAALQGYDIHAFDNRIDLAVPVVTGLAVRRDGGPGTLSFAAAANLDPEAAIEGALSEVLTYLPHLANQVQSRRNDLEAMSQDFGKVRELQDHAHLFGLPAMATHASRYLEPAGVRTFGDTYAGQPVAAWDLLADVRHCQAELARAGCDVIVVDQTTPEQEQMGLRTVRTIAPGLLPIDFGWSRQRALGMPRLRSAFRRAGVRSADLAADDIHRVPHPFP